MIAARTQHRTGITQTGDRYQMTATRDDDTGTWSTRIVELPATISPRAHAEPSALTWRSDAATLDDAFNQLGGWLQARLDAAHLV